MDRSKQQVLQCTVERASTADYERALDVALIVGPAKAYSFVYYSTLRPLDIWFPRGNDYCAVDRFLFSNAPLALEKVLHHSFVPYNVDTWVEVAKQMYAAEYGENPPAWCFSVADNWECKMLALTPAANGTWRAHFFTANGPEGEAEYGTLDAGLRVALESGFRTVRIPDVLETARRLWTEG